MWGGHLPARDFIVSTSKAQVASKVLMLDYLASLNNYKWFIAPSLGRLVFHGSWWGYGPACIDEMFLDQFELIDCVDIDRSAIETSKKLLLNSKYDFHVADSLLACPHDDDNPLPRLVVNTSLEHFAKNDALFFLMNHQGTENLKGIYVQATNMDAEDHLWKPDEHEFKEFLNELTPSFTIDVPPPLDIGNGWQRHSAFLTPK